MIEIGTTPLTIEQVLSVATGKKSLTLSQDDLFTSKINGSAQKLKDHWESDKLIYGVTTGVGDSCERRIPRDLVPEFSGHLASFHGCGTGRLLDAETGKAVLVIRLATFRNGFSGVRYELMQRLVDLVNMDIIPCIPEEGSVGASGDLTPLSYVAAVLMGQRNVYYQGRVQETDQVFKSVGLKPLYLNPKEGLAIMNGTAVMTAIACQAYVRAEHLVSNCTHLTALLTEALATNKAHFDPAIFEQKPHPGQQQVAKQIELDIGYDANLEHSEKKRVQASYAIRCVPHIVGVLADALPWMKKIIEIELNSSNDNPLIHPETGQVLHGGNFYGGHIAFAMDGLKNAVANCADLLDRQMALLVNEKSNNGLPANLSGASEERLPINHGFKAMHIATSAWAAEALKQSIPASIFSRSTESHNQDKVSMGTIAARDCLRVLTLTELTLAATLMAGAQALDLRVAQGELSLAQLSPSLKKFYQNIRAVSPFVSEDRALEDELKALAAKIKDEIL